MDILTTIILVVLGGAILLFLLFWCYFQLGQQPYSSAQDVEAARKYQQVPRQLVQPSVRLNEAAIFKHIDPNCTTGEAAMRKSVQRNAKYPQEVGEINTVFQTQSHYFQVIYDETHGNIIKSNQMIRNWDCKKMSDSRYKVIS